MSMENRLTAKLRAVRRRYRRAFTLVEVSVVVAICGSLASLAVSRYETSVCLAQEREANVTLRNIIDTEEYIFAEHGVYDCQVPLCTFVSYNYTECTGNLGLISISFKGRARFSYETECTSTGVLAHARGTSGHVLGGHLTLDEARLADSSGSVCR